MIATDPPATIDLAAVLHGSETLTQALADALGQLAFDPPSPAARVSAVLCGLAADHATAVRVLVASGLGSSAVAMLRVQYESLVRAVWAAYAAEPDHLARLSGELSAENERTAGRLPNAAAMLKQLEDSGPATLVRLLAEFRDNSWSALNSYVHGGLHAFKRTSEGMPLPIASQLVRQSNGLLMMTAMLLASLAEDPDLMVHIAGLHVRFKDCLPLRTGD